VYVQNASLEIARTEIPLEHGTIAGKEVMPFVSAGLDGFDVNTEEDWMLAEHYARAEPSPLPALYPSSR
jgi:N-acylneuraminate cytidylyltransferase